MNAVSHKTEELRSRSLLKAFTYRILIILLDFVFVYLFTGRIEIALGFMVASNIYTSLAYYIHERIWNRTNWGKAAKPKSSD
ncbi:MAG: DUF2061 domain-containing protein [Candidatus Bathyarchaeia archaeon]